MHTNIAFSATSNLISVMNYPRLLGLRRPLAFAGFLSFLRHRPPIGRRGWVSTPGRNMYSGCEKAIPTKWNPPGRSKRTSEEIDLSTTQNVSGYREAGLADLRQCGGGLRHGVQLARNNAGARRTRGLRTTKSGGLLGAWTRDGGFEVAIHGGRKPGEREGEMIGSISLPESAGRTWMGRRSTRCPRASAKWWRWDAAGPGERE